MTDPYYDIPAISASGINRFLNDSPLHYWLESPFNKDREPSKETPALVFGRLAHCMALTPDLADHEFVAAPVCDKRTNAGKAMWLDFELSAEGRTIVSAEQWKQAAAMRDALYANSGVRQYLSEGEAEEPVTWQREPGGPLCKAKFDKIRQGLVIDYKTTTCTRKDKFERTIAEYGYHRQGDWYSDGAEKKTGERPRGVLIIAQNKDLPEDIGIFALDRDSLSIGGVECARAYEDIAERLKTLDWRSHPPEAQDISLPYWYLKQYNY